jgi:hypothetical protein
MELLKELYHALESSDNHCVGVEDFMTITEELYVL